MTSHYFCLLINSDISTQQRTTVSFTTNRRKVDVENHLFKASFTSDFCFILLKNSQRPMCLICNETIAITKSNDLKLQPEKIHPNFDKSFSLNSDTRKTKINELQRRYLQVRQHWKFSFDQKSVHSLFVVLLDDWCYMFENVAWVCRHRCYSN